MSNKRLSILLLLILVLILAFASCSIQEIMTAESSIHSGYMESEAFETSHESIDIVSDDSVSEESIPDPSVITKEFVYNYMNNYFIIEGPDDEKEALLGIARYQNRGNLDISVTMAFVYDLLDERDPAYYDPNAQNVETEIVTLFIPSGSSVRYYPNPGFANSMGNDASEAGFSGGLIAAEIAGVSFEYMEFDSDSSSQLAENAGAGNIINSVVQTGAVLGNDETIVNDAFVVRERKFDYKDNDHNLVVLSVENQTDKNYMLTVKGQYLDENGTVLKEESQTIEGFAAGWQNNLFFAPDISFDKFLYTLETEVYTGACYTNLFRYSWSHRDITSQDFEKAVWEAKERTLALQAGKPFAAGNPVYLPCITFDLIHECTTQFDDYVCVWESVLFLNEQDEVIDVQLDWITGVYYPMNAGDKVGKGKEYYFFPDPYDRTWPTELKEDLTVLIGVTKAGVYQPEA